MGDYPPTDHHPVSTLEAMSSKGSRSSRSGSGRSSTSRSGAVKTPPKGNTRPAGDDPKAQVSPKTAKASVINGREVELWGVALVSVALLLALSMYLDLAGPVGSGIDTGLGWLVGVGRFALPPLVGGIGIAMVRHRSIEHRARLTIGWLVIVIAALGMLHLINGANAIVAEVDAMSRAGGWLGALIAEPLQSTLSVVGATVVLLGIAVVGVMIVTDTTVPELIAFVRTYLNSLRALSKDTDEDTEDERNREVGDLASPQRKTKKSRRTQSPQDQYEPLVNIPGEPASIYDVGDDPDFAEQPEKKKTTRKPKATPATEAKAPSFNQSTAPATTSQPDQLDLGPPANSDWVLPSTELLVRSEVHEVDEARVAERGRLLEESLASHGVDTTLLRKTVGPTVTRFELELGPGVKVAKVTSLNRDIAYAMAAMDVRILAPIPGKSAIGVEVPNETRQLVSLGDLIVSPEARAAVHPLDVAVGKDIAGRAVFLNLATTPHLLIAGATGAGKSSGLNSIITSLLMRTTPDQVRLILIDPKQVEMGQYARLPHLLTAPVTNPKKAANALGWAVKEMEKRYDLLVEVGFRDISGYNAAYDRGELREGNDGSDGNTGNEYKRLPYIVVVVDELNDLMMVAARDVEECITRIAQKARAVGIHLIVATQRPSVNVITGVIKANIPARMAFAVSSLTDSRVILDQPGAEKLIGQGDMLLLPGNSNVPQRVQGSWVGEDEVRKVVAHWRRQAPEVVYVSGIEGEENGGSSVGTFGGGGSDDDELLQQAIDIVVRSGVGSTSLLQRKLKIGFARAGRLMDLLEEQGIVGPSEGSKARTVLMSIEEYELRQQG
jgi:DNA segregation ATPase FtsK/SpoIIIE, S-DNA-T family